MTVAVRASTHKSQNDEAGTENPQVLPIWAEPFLRTMRSTGNVAASCRAAGVSRMEVYAARKRYPDFEKAWGDALDEALDGLELMAWQRAAEQSDTLMIFLLKAHRPHLYRDPNRFTFDPTPLLQLQDAIRDSASRILEASGGVVDVGEPA